jgi:hypothetical protein
VRVGESLAVGSSAAIIAWLATQWIDGAVAVIAAVIAAGNGGISGWRGVYEWRRARGWVAVLLDSTWALVPTAGGLLAHLVAPINRPVEYEASLSRRQNRHVYRRGAALKPGFALTVGNVISGAGDVDHVRRRRLITDHENVHIWQARWFGLFYPLIYALWALAGLAAGVVLWLRRGRSVKLAAAVESCAYYLNPFEWWAYSRDDLWPPPGKVANLGWRRPAVRSFTARDAEASR